MISTTQFSIKEITEPVIVSYFETLNAGDFEATASLFAAEGALCPPFESPIVGREAIANYLKTEAQGLQLYPLEGIAEGLEDGLTEFQIQGKVQTPLFGVNVAWQFIVNAAKEILSVEVKLLASLEELVQMRR
ncbi:nuclear transport factor 2 [Hydrococcus rivularis NIES-593]|uniref:Nuclear transport factor 2 n=1 Tax=Hydrococcus rivularis NIES-593 TaxID=1921803 RepID=A0A1U7HIV6_9CYAN|nr:ketosteroid isomerase family protein [Hydrococcus rivularis]OKH23468.1 nuclear transport factor 2 [Hydrococcus rivularis NIES-593]